MRLRTACPARGGRGGERRSDRRRVDPPRGVRAGHSGQDRGVPAPARAMRGRRGAARLPRAGARTFAQSLAGSSRMDRTSACAMLGPRKEATMSTIQHEPPRRLGARIPGKVRQPRQLQARWHARRHPDVVRGRRRATARDHGRALGQGQAGPSKPGGDGRLRAGRAGKSRASPSPRGLSSCRRTTSSTSSS